jgi:hypothetical protein
MRFDKQSIAQIILVVLFLLACLWIALQPNPFDVKEIPTPPPDGQVATPNPTYMALKATEYQQEIEENKDQTTGIVFGGTGLVILVIIGTLLAMSRR